MLNPITWQKSSYSEESSNCVYLATPGNETVHLRESDTPDVILTTTRTAIRALLTQVRSTPGPPGSTRG